MPHKDMQELARQIEKLGYPVNVASNGHYQVRHPQSGQLMVTFSASPTSATMARMKAISDLRRKGIDVRGSNSPSPNNFARQEEIRAKLQQASESGFTAAELSRHIIEIGKNRKRRFKNARSAEMTLYNLRTKKRGATSWALDLINDALEDLLAVPATESPPTESEQITEPVVAPESPPEPAPEPEPELVGKLREQIGVLQEELRAAHTKVSSNTKVMENALLRAEQMKEERDRAVEANATRIKLLEKASHRIKEFEVAIERLEMERDQAIARANAAESSKGHVDPTPVFEAVALMMNNRSSDKDRRETILETANKLWEAMIR